MKFLRVFASRRLEISRARASVYFARPTVAIAKIRDYSQSMRVSITLKKKSESLSNQRFPQLGGPSRKQHGNTSRRCFIS